MKRAKTIELRGRKLSALSVVVCCFALSAGAGNVIYQNDFTTRESSQPIPEYGVVHQAQAYPYLATYSALCYNPQSKASASRDVFYASSVGGVKNENRPNYDGWFMPYFNVNNKLAPIIKAYQTTGYNNTLTFYYSSSADLWGYALQDIHNVFTNGELRIQVDMKGPELWDSGKRTYLRVCPVFGKYMDILAWNGDYVWGRNAAKSGSKVTTDAYAGVDSNAITPGEFGIINVYSSDGSRSITHLNYVGGQSHVSYGTRLLQNYNKSNWVRFVATYKLDAAKFELLAYEFPDDIKHPSLDTATPESAIATKTDIPFPAPLTDELGGISGIGVHARGYFLSNEAVTNKVLVDNFRLSWKAPGASDFETFYENDFSNRWYKTICAASHGTTTSYSSATVTTNLNDDSTLTMGYLYKPSQNTFATNNIVPALSSSASSVQPVGFDGWRRLPYMDGNVAYCCNTASTGSKYDTGDGTNYLAIGSSAGTTPQCALLANTIGETYTSGKVHLSVDVRIPEKGSSADVEDALRAAVGLGSTALYSSARGSLAANVIAGCGYQRVMVESNTSHVPYVLSPASGVEVVRTSETSYTEPEVPYLYRMDIVADIDERTYDLSVTPLAEKGIDSSFEPTEQPIFTKTGLPFASSATDIGTFYLYGFGIRDGAGVNYSTTVRVTFDNIRIWRQATGAVNETLVYFNDFRTRTRTPSGESQQVQRAVGYLADQYDREDGQDHWVRRSVAGDEGYWATATVRDDNGNHFLALGREIEAGRRVQVAHTFGSSEKRPFRFKVDIRPPAAWRVEKDGMALVSLGSTQMDQTQTTEANFNAYRQMAFGFCGAPGDSYCTWYRTEMQPVAHTVENGVATAVPLCEPSAISNDHWYRFSVSVDPSEGLYNVNVYDLGTAHPTVGSSVAELVGSARNLHFLNDSVAGEGIGAFNIHAYGMGGVVGEAGVDADNVLIDNIIVTPKIGTTLTIR